MPRAGAISASRFFLPQAGSVFTPTTQASNLSIFSKETEQDLSWTRGNGTNVIVIGKSGVPVDSFPIDGTSYAANPTLGAGSELGTGNFVVYIGSGTSVTVAGLTADALYFYDVYEFNDDGLKYLTSLATNTFNAFTAFTYDDQFSFSGSGDPPGQTYLEASARVFYDFTLLTGTDGGSISNGNAGLVDQGPGGYTATIVNTPTVEDLTLSGPGTIKTLGDVSTNGLDAGHDGDAWFNSDFEVWIGCKIEDGQPSDQTHLIGAFADDGISIEIRSTAAAVPGGIQIAYRTGAAQLRWASAAAVFSDGSNAFCLLRVRYDYTGDAITVIKYDESGNPTTISGSVTQSSISANNPVDWGNNSNIYIGTANVGGPLSNPTQNYITSIAVTDLLTTQQAIDVSEYLTFNGGSPSGLADYLTNETIGFNITANPGALQLEGEPLGWQDWISHNDLFDADLEEFELEIEFEITDNPTTGTPGIGLGIRNDLSSEANRAVVAEFVTDTDSPDFGKIIVYSGNGTVSQTGFVFRSQSSGAFTPALNDEYTFTFSRTLQNSDAFYAITVTRESDGSQITTSWIEVGRPSSAFFGTTMRTWIHQNGGDHTISYFVNRRVGEDTGAPPSPGTFDIYVDINSGDDSFPGTISQPKRTNVGGLAAISALGGSNRTMHTSAGTYTEAGTLSIPLNLGVWEGSGKDITIITGASAIYNPPSGSFSSSGYLLNMISSSPTAVTTHIKNMTLSGSNRNIRGGVYLSRRNGSSFTNVKWDRFGSTGIWIGEVDGLDMTGVDFIETSWGGTSYNLGAITLWNVTDFELSNYNIEALTFGNGQGIVQAGGSGERTLRDCLWHDGIIRLNRDSPYVPNGHCFAMELIHCNYDNLQIYNSTFYNNISFNQHYPTQGATKIYNNNFFLPNKGLCIEAQIDDLEFYNNYVTGCNGTVIGIYNAVGSSPNPSNFTGWNVHHNVLEMGTSNFGQGVVGSNAWPIDNVTIANNTVVYTTTSGQILPLFYYNASGQSVANLLIENNAIQGQAPVNQNMLQIAGGGLAAGAIARNNKATHVNTLQTVTNLTGGAGQNNTTGHASLGFVSSGNKPTPFYNRASGSVLTGTGFGGTNVGAY